jgi:hypothetical protein
MGPEFLVLVAWTCATVAAGTHWRHDDAAAKEQVLRAKRQHAEQNQQDTDEVQLIATREEDAHDFSP